MRSPPAVPHQPFAFQPLPGVYSRLPDLLLQPAITISSAPRATMRSFLNMPQV